MQRWRDRGNGPATTTVSPSMTLRNHTTYAVPTSDSQSAPPPPTPAHEQHVMMARLFGAPRCAHP